MPTSHARPPQDCAAVAKRLEQGRYSSTSRFAKDLRPLLLAAAASDAEMAAQLIKELSAMVARRCALSAQSHEPSQPSPINPDPSASCTLTL